MFRFLYFSLLCYGCSLCYGQIPTYEEVKSLMISGEGSNDQWSREQPYVILISVDGFRHDYAEKYQAKNILNFAKSGVTTENMIASFPSKTLPNHYTLVTGLYPAAHGIVSNEFFDRKKNEWYKIRNPDAVRNGEWYGGCPLWVLAERSKMLSASMFWIGSDADIQGTLPNYYYHYNGSVSNGDRFHQVLDWLTLAEDVRPHFISVYFSLVDDAGHSFGPDSERTKEAVLLIDSLFGEFQQAVEKIDLPVNIILVSDHGMAETKYGIILPEIVDLKGCQVAYNTPTMIYCDDKVKVERLQKELEQDGRITVYRKADVPSAWHFENDDRVGDLILYTEAPTVILERPQRVRGGNHGFDPYVDEDMSAFFAASGPAFKEGLKIAPFENVNVYPLIAKVLGLRINEEIDGNLDVFKPVLKDSVQN